MHLRKFVYILCSLALLRSGAYAQTVSSTLVGTVVDPAGATVPSAKLTLTDPATGSSRNAVTDATGNFRFLEVPPGTYTLSAQSSGFKVLTETNIVVAANETRDVGKLALAVGSLTESVTVLAEATPIQLASSEKSLGIDANQLENITLKGRDLFSFISMVPGVIDTTGSRDVTTPNAIGGIYINGNNGSKINFTVDGITDLDTGSNSTVHYEPNMDSIQELKVLTSNYQAEFGRNSGGTITAVTKSGTRDFHVTGLWTHRHEEFNANTWLNNHTLTAQGTASPIPRYRYNVESYTVGGPAFIPKLLNKDRKRLFFFFAQEYTGQFVTGGAQTKYTPTALERAGNFSQSLANNGSLITITDPTTGAPFPGNIIPASRADPTGIGPAMLNFFPLPNFTATAANQLNVVNYFESASATHPRRNDVLRVDGYITSKINGYFRWINDHDDMIALYQGVQFSQDKGGTLGEAGIAPIDHPNPGHGYSGTVVYSITPTLINEFSIAESWNTWAYYSTDNYKTEDRSLIPNLPGLFPIPTQNPPGVSKFNGYLNLLPQFQFGSPPSNSMSYTRNQTSAGNEENFNTIWTFSDNISKVVKGHSFKAGTYLEYNTKLQPGSNPYSGSFNFQPDALNNLNTGDGYANAYLGYMDLYQQATARATFNVHYWNAEFYVQDNWRVTPRLTLDLGVRFYHQPSQNDVNHTFANFFPSLYSASSAPRLYVPGMSGGKRVAIDPGTGAVAPVAYIGLYVPNSGNPADGFQLLGVNGVSPDTYNISAVNATPRIGFAYDVSGDGKTAIRGGFGIFYNRLDGNQVYALAGQPPYGYTPQINYAPVSSIAASGGSLIFGPQTYNAWPQTQVPWNGARNASIDIQRSMAGMVFDLGYTGNWGFNQNISYNINPIPIGTRFLPQNADPTNGGKPLPDVLLRTKYLGYNTLNQYAEIGNTNYNALTFTAQRRLSHGLAFGASYTYSRAMYLNAFTPVVPDNHSWNYGRSNTDRRHHLVINYSYDLPKASRYVGKYLGAITDRWTYSGVVVISSGAPFNPGCGFASGTQPDYTGTPDVGARCLVVGNPYSGIPSGAFFNPAAFALPALGTVSPATPQLGDLGGGSGVLSYPHYTNFDMTLFKKIPIGLGEGRGFELQFQAYNVFNHTEVSGLNTTVQLNPANNVVLNPLQAGTISSTLPNRVLAFGLRFQY